MEYSAKIPGGTGQNPACEWLSEGLPRLSGDAVHVLNSHVLSLLGTSSLIWSPTNLSPLLSR